MFVCVQSKRERGGRKKKRERAVEKKKRERKKSEAGENLSVRCYHLILNYV